jgi:hypothetical protein
MPWNASTQCVFGDFQALFLFADCEWGARELLMKNFAIYRYCFSMLHNFFEHFWAMIWFREWQWQCFFAFCCWLSITQSSLYFFVSSSITHHSMQNMILILKILPLSRESSITLIAPSWSTSPSLFCWTRLFNVMVTSSVDSNITIFPLLIQTGRIQMIIGLGRRARNSLKLFWMTCEFIKK